MIFKLLLRIIMASGTRAIVSYLFQYHAALPIDFGLPLSDKGACFCAHKTCWGVLSSIVVRVLKNYRVLIMGMLSQREIFSNISNNPIIDSNTVIS